MELSEILSRCDHTLLRTDAGSAEIRQLCDEAVKYGCVSPDVFKDIKVGMKVRCFFDSKKKVSYMVAVNKT